MSYRKSALAGFMLALGFTICLVTAPAAQDQQLALYDEGSFAFRYDQWPFGSYDGNFSAEGALVDTLLWGTEQLQSCGGSLGVVSDTTLAWCYGAVYNPDTTVDLAALFIRGVGDLAPGNYPVDITNFMAGFAYIDGITNFTFPDLNTDIVAWLSSLQADHTFYPTSGTIHVSAVTDTGFTGTFSGLMTDPDDILFIQISNGNFNMSGHPIVTSAPAAMALLMSHGAHPNPFNPKTSLRFTLAHESDVEVGIFDISGRRVARLFDGRLGAGDQRLDWNALDENGAALPAGLYLYRITTPLETGTGKLVLLP